MSSITAIFVTYNSEAVIAPALAALANEAEIGGVFVVDNASTDGTKALIQRQFPHVKLIENQKNEGFGRGNNIALAQVTTPYALLINPDAVMQPGALRALLEAAQSYPDAAILAPQLVDAKGCDYVSYKRNVFDREYCSGKVAELSGDSCANYLSGAVWLVNMAHLQKVGFFDPAIFLYYEDDDLCIRVRKAGFGIVLVASSRAMHMMGASSGACSVKGEYFKQMHMLWSRLYIEQKYNGAVSAERLSRKLSTFFQLKTIGYALIFNARKLACYRGRLAGIKAFNANPTQAPGL